MPKIVPGQSEIMSESKGTKRTNVIKHQAVVIKEPIVVNSNAETENGAIEILRENGAIVGVRYRCLCGREAELYFDYETRTK
jgi:hypothetical protein